jgi:Fur family peroxide stress response transcriptional regulator
VRPAQKRERLEQFETLCRQRGLALTVQRRTILEAVLDRPDHPTADHVYEAVKHRIPGISRTTVYRVLDALVDMGVITKACSAGATIRFDSTIERHHHLTCLYCDKLIDFHDPRLDARIKLPEIPPRSFRIRDFSIYFHGICAACRAKYGTGKSPVKQPASRAKTKTAQGKRKPGTPERRKT